MLNVIIKNAMLSTALLVVVGCANNTHETIAESDGKIVLSNAQLGQRYEAVMEKAQTQYDVEAECESRRVALSKQRKAFSYDACYLTPDGAEYAGAPVSEVVYHFIEQSLVRVDIRVSGDTAVFDTFKTDMQSFFAARSSEAKVISDASFEWTAADEIAGVRAGTGAANGNVFVRLLDRTLNADAPWLAAP